MYIYIYSAYSVADRMPPCCTSVLNWPMLLVHALATLCVLQQHLKRIIGVLKKII